MEHQEFVEKMNEVAKTLGMSFEFCNLEYNPNSGEMKGSPANFRISTGGRWKQENRISISPSWPKDNRGQTCRPHETGKLEITIADSSTVERIISAIQKRFMPAYLPEYAKGLTWKKNHDDYETKKNENLKILADYFGVESSQDAIWPPICNENNFIPNRIEVGNIEAKFELSLSIENAIKVFDFLKTL